MQLRFMTLIPIVFAGLTFIVLGDAAGKALARRGFDPYFTAWMRFALAAVLIAPVARIERGELTAFLDWRIIGRAALICAGICGVLTAVKTEPISNVYGAFFISPVVAYTLSVLLLGEQVTAVRTWLLLLGFAGVMAVVKPGAGVSTGMAFAVMAGVCHGSYLVATRAVAEQFRGLFLMTSQLIIGAVLLAPLALAHAHGDMPPIGMNEAALLAASAAGSACGNTILVWASSKVPASLIAPLVYLQLVAATAVGYLLFGEWPDWITFVGLMAILASGLLSFAAVRWQQK